jgi:hypothetical protein
VAWFEQHPAEAATIANNCLLKTQTGPECANAESAIREASRKRLELFRRGF